MEHVGVMVSDYDKSVAFYRDIIGLEVINELKLDNGVALAFLGFPHAKETVVELIGEVKGNFADEGKVHHIAFTVVDIESEVKRLKELDVSFVNESITTLPNGARNIFFYGPDKERLELLEWPQA